MNWNILPLFYFILLEGYLLGGKGFENHTPKKCMTKKKLIMFKFKNKFIEIKKNLICEKMLSICIHRAYSTCSMECICQKFLDKFSGLSGK